MVNQRHVVLAGLSLALAGALGAVYAGPLCDACQDAKALSGGLRLDWIGVGGYAVLLAVALVRPGAGVLRWGVLIAAGVHVALVGELALHRLACWACLTTAAGAWIAAAALYLSPGTPESTPESGPARHNALTVLLVAAACTLLGLTGLQLRGNALMQAQAQALLAEVRPTLAPIPEDSLLLLVYRRDGCRHCAQFEAEVLPQLDAVVREALPGTTLKIETRQAPKDLPTPTFLVLGPHRDAAHAGFLDEKGLCRVMLGK